MTRSRVVAQVPQGPSPASMRGGALVGAFDHRERSRERSRGGHIWYSCTLSPKGTFPEFSHRAVHRWFTNIHQRFTKIHSSFTKIRFTKTRHVLPM